ncbi:hydrogen peroxide-inducible genes activator [Primorskyibacter marinus]|uniref:hydrogen peroxide-inducible genes activator n=1 Tax=Primorskyibacter marinus TaxID=1977320 RepID=UPI000E30724E|nr:hydrogen peroxide-inducible genes activator [Primorskyibacter marinus]
MRNLTLKQLRYFEALLQHAHFGRAADACGISQPALSVQIKDLEEDLGTVLFERGPRQIRPTSFGKEFARQVRDILRAVDELGELARASRDRLVGRMRIGVIPTIAPYLLPTLLRELSQDYADLDIHIRETLTSRLVQELLEGRIDTAIVALPVSEPSLTEIPLFTENFVLIRPPQEAPEPILDAESLRDMRLLLLEEGHCFRDQALSFCRMNAAMPRDGLDGSSLATLVQMVGAGIGVTLIPEMAVPVETRAATVTVSRFSTPEPSRTIGMIWRKTNPLANELREIAAVVRRSADGLAQMNDRRA